jgi:hypothetical protein
VTVTISLTIALSKAVKFSNRTLCKVHDGYQLELRPQRRGAWLKRFSDVERSVGHRRYFVECPFDRVLTEKLINGALAGETGGAIY